MTVLEQQLSRENASVNFPLSPLDHEVLRHLNYTLGCLNENIDSNYLYRALAIAVRDRLVENWSQTKAKMEESNDRRVYYLSLEFLIGRSLSNAIQNLTRSPRSVLS